MLVLPTSAVPAPLSELLGEGCKPIKKFLNGYRNKIDKDLCWALVPDANHCALAFCYELVDNEEKLSKLENMELGSAKIQKIHGFYLMLAKEESKFARPEQLRELGQGKISELTNQLESSKQVVESILLNNFQTFEAYQQSGLNIISANPVMQLPEGQKQAIIDIFGRISGPNLYSVPQLDSKTGKWSQTKRLELKIKSQKTEQGQGEPKTE